MSNLDKFAGVSAQPCANPTGAHTFVYPPPNGTATLTGKCKHCPATKVVRIGVPGESPPPPPSEPKVPTPGSTKAYRDMDQAERRAWRDTHWQEVRAATQKRGAPAAMQKAHGIPLGGAWADIVKKVAQEHGAAGSQEKNPNAVALGHLGGRKGGKARAAALAPGRRSEIAKQGGEARWRAAKQVPPAGVPVSTEDQRGPTFAEADEDALVEAFFESSAGDDILAMQNVLWVLKDVDTPTAVRVLAWCAAWRRDGGTLR